MNYELEKGKIVLEIVKMSGSYHRAVWQPSLKILDSSKDIEIRHDKRILKTLTRRRVSHMKSKAEKFLGRLCQKSQIFEF